MILESGNRVRAETYGDQTSLTIDVTEREDTGNYKIVLQNEAGEATASVKIKVVGKSSFSLEIIMGSPLLNQTRHHAARRHS